MFTMTKETRLNLRISEAFRADIEALAEYHGLSMSSYAHSLLVKAVRREREATPEAFILTNKPTKGIRAAEVKLAPVVARIEPPTPRTVSQEGIEEMQRRLKPRKRKTG